MALTIVDIPVESLALILNMLGEVEEVQRVLECVPESKVGDLSALNWVYLASRILTDDEEEWFAKRKIYVQLLVTHTVGYSFGQLWKEFWYLNGKLHREGDDPAIIRHPHPSLHAPYYLYGYLGEKRVWCKYGNCHRDNDLPAEIFDNGTKRWFQYGELHREGDEPAEILADGTKRWYKHGKLHRAHDLPAEMLADGTKRWYQHGELCRAHDLPAEILADGTKQWYQHGKLHRANDLPAIMSESGSGCVQMWYKDGLCHRENDLPAVILSDGTKKWYKHGNCHREGAPAYITVNGYEEWWIDGHIQPAFRKQPEWKLIT